MPLKHETITDLFTDIADAIREKTDSNEPIVADDFPDSILSIEQPLPLYLTKVKDLINTTVTIDTELSANATIATYNLDPVLQKSYSATENFVVISYVIWVGDYSGTKTSGQCVSSVSFIPVIRAYGSTYYATPGSGTGCTAWMSNWSYCSTGSQVTGLRIVHGSSDATNLQLKLTFYKVNPCNFVVAGDYLVKAVLYKYDILSLGGSL